MARLSRAFTLAALSGGVERPKTIGIRGLELEPLGLTFPRGWSAGPKLWLGTRQRASVRCAHWLGPGAAAPSPDDVEADEGVGRIDRAASWS